MNLKTDIPQVGEKIKAGDPMFGPVCVIQKTQRVDRIDTEGSDIKKWKLMPQEEEIDPKIAPNKDGCDETLIVPIIVNGDRDNIKQFYIVWCNHETKDPTKEEILERLYGEKEEDKVDAITELQFWGSKYQEIADILNEVDFVRVNNGSVLWGAMCALNNMSSGLKGLIDIDRFCKSIEASANALYNAEGKRDNFIDQVHTFRKELLKKYGK